MAHQSSPKAGPDFSPPVISSKGDSAPPVSPNDVWVPAQPIGRNRSKWPAISKLLAGSILFLFVTTVLILIVIFGIMFFYSDLIFPGTRVMDVDVGSMTRDEAATVIAEEWEQQSLLMVYAESVWPVGATDLGLILDAPATVEEAYEQGRSLDGLLRLLVNGAQVQPVWSFDPSIAREFLEGFVEQVSIQPVNAGLQIKNGEVLEILPVDGRVLDLEATMVRLQENPAHILSDGRLPLTMRPIAPDVTDVSRRAQEARHLLSTTVSVHAYDPIRNESLEWSILPSQWAAWMTLKLSAEGDNGFEWVVDEEAALNSLNTSLPAVGDDRYFDVQTLIPKIAETVSAQGSEVEARIFHHPRRHIVQSGETLSGIGRAYGIPYPWIQQANPESDLLLAGDEILIPSADEMLPLPVVENKRVVVSISEQRAWVYEDGQVKWDWPASTGIDSSPTAPGIFQIQNHESNAYAGNWDLWMPNFMGIYRPVPTSDFMNGFHGFPTRNGSTLLWTGDLGHQVTYGCILLSSENASQLFDWAENGVVVEVLP